MMAVRKNNTEAVTLLLNRGADITVKDADDRTCLFIAAEEDCVETFLVRCLCSRVSSLLEWCFIISIGTCWDWCRCPDALMTTQKNL